MQLVGNYHDNVLGCIDVLQDDDYLYTIMPYCEGGDLFGRIMSSPRRNTPLNGSESSRRPRADSPGHSVDEPQARIWFRQLLSVSVFDIVNEESSFSFSSPESSWMDVCHILFECESCEFHANNLVSLALPLGCQPMSEFSFCMCLVARLTTCAFFTVIDSC
jgi:serine/threonine protein kinase